MNLLTKKKTSSLHEDVFYSNRSLRALPTATKRHCKYKQIPINLVFFLIFKYYDKYGNSSVEQWCVYDKPIKNSALR